jgi:tetratricopeptide (TPR) repeat protein
MPVAIGGAIAAVVATVAMNHEPTRPIAAATVAAEPTPRGDPGLVAVLPFEIATDDARLGTARDTLPFILIEGMGAHGKLRTIDYFVVRREVEPPGSSPAELAKWREASVRAGAGVLVRGRLEARGPDLRLRLVLETATGESLGDIERTTTFDALPGTLRTLAAEAASRVLGGEVARPASHAYAWDYDTLLADGARLLEHGDFATAIARLEAAAAIVPDAPDAWFYLAVALSWSEAPDERAFAATDRALEAGISGARRGFLLGFREYMNRDYVRAAEVYREALQRDAGDPYLTYGLFEALYHGGRPREAMEVVHGLGGEAPAIHQGLMHVLDYQAAQGNAAGLERALGLAEAIDPVVAEGWRIHTRVFAGDYAGALEQLGALDPEQHPPGQTLLTRMEVLALSGEIPLALALAEPMARTAEPNVIPMLGLEAARGADEERRRYLAIGLAEIESQRHELRRARGLSDLVVVSVPVAAEDELRRLAAAAPFDVDGTLSGQVSRVLLADALRQGDVLEAAAASKFPEARALAAASIAEAKGELDNAASHLRDAIASSLDGRLITVERWRLARVQRAKGDLAGAASTCARVIRPPRFHWSWGATVGACLEWTIEAGGDDVDAARDLQRRLQN